MSIFITKINTMGTVVEESQTWVAEIGRSMGFRELGIRRTGGAEDPEELKLIIDGITNSVCTGDIVIFQYPTWKTGLFNTMLVQHLRHLGAKMIMFVQDVIPLLDGNNIAGYIGYDVTVMNLADLLIMASPQLHETMIGYGLNADIKTIYQPLWDYPAEQVITSHETLRRLIFTGGSDFSWYEGATPIHQFSSSEHRAEHSSIVWHGFMEKHDLIKEMARGGFGLVYESDDDFYRYDCMNQSYKFGGYIAAGLPVIVRRGSAQENFVLENQIGFSVDTVAEADEIVQNITDEAYNKLYNNVTGIQFLVTRGEYTRRMLSEALIQLMEK